MAHADVLVASPVNEMTGLEMCSATPPDNSKSPHTPRLLQRAGLRALEQIASDKMDVVTTLCAADTDAVTSSPSAIKRKRLSQSPTTSGKPDVAMHLIESEPHVVVCNESLAGTLDSEGSETSPDELEDLQPSPELTEVKLPTPTNRSFVAKGNEYKRRKGDVIENALKRFHQDEANVSRCAEFTSICYVRDKTGDDKSKAIKMRVQVGVSFAQGARAYMEDRYSVVERLSDAEEDADLSLSLLAVYDGHNGAYASEYARRRFKELLGENNELRDIGRRAQQSELTEDDVERIRAVLVDAFATVDAETLQRTILLNKRDGSTVLMGLLVGGKLFVANLGDSRGVLAKETNGTSDSKDEEQVSSVVRLSVDHKPDLKSEMDRVEEAGGKVIFSGCWRVAHDQVPLRLAISRSLGDHPLKSNLPPSCVAPLVSVIPDVRILNVKADGEYLIFASDGLWDRLSDDDAAKIVRAKVAEFHWSKGAPSQKATKEALHFAANALVETALSKRSMDNITAMVISFSKSFDEDKRTV